MKAFHRKILMTNLLRSFEELEDEDFNSAYFKNHL